MSSISELQMSIAFERLIKSGVYIGGIPQFDLIYKEVVCQQGIADFVGLVSKYGLENLELFENVQSLESGTLIFSLLKPKAARSKSFLQEKTGLSEKTVSRVLRELCKSNLVSEITDGHYILSSEAIMPKLDIWAFELKISNWKRALFQALQYKAFANYSLVVFPFEKENVLGKQIDLFRELNVGILLFDVNTNHVKFLLRPKKERASSKWHMLFALGQLAHQHSCENNKIESSNC